MMFVYGGEAARFRGNPFGRHDSDIDLFGTAQELADLHQMLVARYPDHPVGLHAISDVAPRYIIQCNRLRAPDGWRNIEFEVATPAMTALLLALPDNSSGTLFGVPCLYASEWTDCLMKAAVLDVLPGRNIKHRHDVARAGRRTKRMSAPRKAFDSAWRERLMSELEYPPADSATTEPSRLTAHTRRNA